MARFFTLLFIFVTFTPFQSFAQNDTTFIIGGVQFKMIFVKGGTFRMGVQSDTLLKSISPDFKSQYNMEHYVSLSDYYIMETEVTQELWEKVMHYNRSFHKGKLLPVENVSWKKCEIFCKRLSRKTGLLFRLPTVSEWEYAASGGLNKDGLLFSGDDNIDSVAWYIGNSLFESHCVKSLKCNSLGLYDMSGNVGEWCHDWFCRTLDTTLQTNPTGPNLRQLRDDYNDRLKEFTRFFKPIKHYRKYHFKLKTVCGGFFDSDWYSCITSNHSGMPHTNRSPVVGFRVIMKKANN